MLRTALLLACLVAAASAQSSAKISLSHTRLTLKKDSSYNVKFTLDEPIICPDQSKNSECAVVVEIDNHSPAKVAIDNCIIKWNWDEWSQPRFLRVSAVENFVNEGELKFNLVTKPAKSDARYYKDFNPSDIEIVTQPNPSAACSGTGDPHYWTFDRQYWHVYTAGRYVLYSNRDRANNNNDFEIQVQTYAYPARHCGFAAKEGNDIVVFPCGGGHRRSCGTQECQRGGFPKVSVSGCWVTVTFQSGRQFKRCGTGFYAYAPGRDYKNGVQGICGNFNGNNQDDSPCGGCKLHNLASLFDGQRPDRDLFNWYPTGIVSAAPASPHVEECTYVPPPFRPPILTHPDAEDITDLIKDVQKEDNPDPVEFDFTDDFAPEPEPMDRGQAEDLCVTTIRASAVARACLEVIPDFDLLPFIEDCTDDLAETSDEEFIAEAIEDMERGCARVAAAGDTDGWERDEEGQPIPPEELRDSICPSTTDPATGELKTCNNHGTCKDVVCTCEEGFVGADCGVETGKPPVAVRVIEPFCDTRTGKGCGSPTHNSREGKYITVQGSNIFNTDKLVCRFTRDGASTIKTDGFYLGSTEALCAVPDISLADFEPLTYTVSLSSDDGATFGESTATFTWYDAICDVCELVQGKEQCKPNPDSCTIDEQCHLRTQPSENNICLQCIPEESTSAWSYNYDNHVECGPSFADSLLPVTVLHADAKKDQVIITLDAANPLVKEDPNFELTYTIVKAEDAFGIRAQSGEVYLTRDVDANSLPTSFSNLVEVRVEDQAGNFASVGVVVDFVTVNQVPAFPEGGFSFTVSEKAQKGDVVGQAEAQDADNEDRFSGLSYQISSAPIGHDNDFVIDTETGTITVNTDALDFETFPLYSIHIRATDNGGQFHVTEVKIQLEDAPEPPTAIALDTNELEENAAAGTVVGTLSAEDPEGGAMTFSVVGGDASGFAISAGNKLVSTRAFDFEAGTGSVDVEVQAKDSTDLTFSQPITVNIVDVNEAPRVLGLEQTTFSEASSLTRLTKVLVEDDDNSADPNKQIVACTVTKDDGDYFEISQNSLVLVKKLDHEAAPTVTITIVCADDGEPTARSEPRDFEITVTNANDAPENVGFVGTVDTQDDFTVPEDHDAATPFGTLTATDHDEDSNAITFSLEGSRFELVGDKAACTKASNGATTCTQAVRLADGEIFDYETAAEETLVVSADEGAVKSVTNVRIVVTNVNEPPTGVRWVNGADSISEDAQNGDLVGQLEAVDEDAEQQYTFTLKQGGDVFYIDTEDRRRAVSSAATIRVKDASKLNFEESSSFALEVEVKEDIEGGFTMTAETNVAVTDAPVRVFAGAEDVLKVSIKENVAIGTVVTELVMTGDDRRGAPWNVAYNLAMTDDSNGHFELDGTTVKVARPINRELLKVRPFEIEVTASADDASNLPTPVKSYHEITVDIDNVDEAPEFGESAYSFSVNDDEGTGKTMNVMPAAISAADPDENAEATIFNMAEDTAEQQTLAEYFEVDSFTGAIKTRKALASALEGGEYTMVVRATAGGLTSEVTVTVTVVDDCADNACFSGESCVDLQFDYQCCSAGGSCINKIKAEARNPQGSSGSDNSAGTGMIIGIVVAALVLIVLVAIIVLRRRNDRNADSLFKNDDNGIYTANPTYRAPSEGPQYAAVSRNPHFVPGVSNPMYDWYKPDMTRQECTEVLMGSDDGTFVVRDSKATPGWHMLGVKAGSSVVHEKIKMNEDGMYELLPASNARQPRFADVPALVAHYGEPRDDVPYVLTLNFSNPMYGMGAAAPSQYQYAPGVALPNDPAAPHVPLKEKEKDSVAQLAAGADIYGNTAEARIAMGSDV